jgi:hypothetical protein
VAQGSRETTAIQKRQTNKIAVEIASQHNPDDLFEQAQSAEEHGDIAEAERLKTVLPP